MKTIIFNKTECGVDFLLNVLPGDQVKQSYASPDFYNTDYFEILFLRRRKVRLYYMIKNTFSVIIQLFSFLHFKKDSGR